MNQVRNSIVSNISKDSEEYSVISALCQEETILGNGTTEKAEKWGIFRQLLRQV